MQRNNYHITENDVLYEDNHLLIINKPAGILSQGDITNDASIVDLAKDFLKKKYKKLGNVFAGLPHRLDRPVSGAMVICKTSKALTRVNKLFSNRSFTKTYHAISDKRPSKSEDEVVSYLKKNPIKNKVDCASEPFKDSKKAVLQYKLLFSQKGYSLIEVNLLTGRPHQIRVQLNSIDCPILGDVKYNKQKPLIDKSIALHARKLQFIHPVSNELISVIAPYPDRPWWKIF